MRAFEIRLQRCPLSPNASWLLKMLIDNSPPSSSRSQTPLSLDLSTIPPLTQPPPPSNTLLITNLQDLEVFRPENLQIIKDLIHASAPIHSWAPLKSFRRIIVSFCDEDSAIRIRQILDGETIMGERVRVYFGQPTPIEAKDEHLPLPDAGKLFFISPPPSPPHGWEMKLEGAPNKQVHAEDLVEALAKLHHKPQFELPTSPMSDGEMTRGRHRSGSSTTIYRPENHGDSPLLPAIEVEDLTDDQKSISPTDTEPRPIMAHTARPPVELMDHS
jgi:Calcipressin